MSKRVLIVDDAKFMRAMLKQLVEGCGATVVGEAEDGVEAIALVKALQPDLVLLDITMPRMDGIEALRHLLQLDPAGNIVIVSAVGQKEIMLEALKLGAKDYIIKPFVAEQAIQVLTKML